MHSTLTRALTQEHCSGCGCVSGCARSVWCRDPAHCLELSRTDFWKFLCKKCNMHCQQSCTRRFGEFWTTIRSRFPNQTRPLEVPLLFPHPSQSAPTSVSTKQLDESASYRRPKHLGPIKSRTVLFMATQSCARRSVTHCVKPQTQCGMSGASKALPDKRSDCHAERSMKGHSQCVQLQADSKHLSCQVNRNPWRLRF